ncbi:hypothetical protein ASG37_04880 [Sphingomonas sp. Leaf407]|uniref:hypothetical protein n=1 Tax=unclassified Sphingomonas TaxID=196159 RepID=UPI0006F55573|nr:MULTISPECIES: hypothetical protein [unclassified Sphingomonas]KQN37000.1 hypothetical protein ASE97_10795 [Sphingomonas sp. Leaf42]KQT30427.1 hypothetical protein ASG37_04880 [Sphingomonas sp. Leaf407]
MPNILAPAGFVPASAITFGPIGGEATAVSPATPLPAYMPGGLTVVSASLTRPADTTAYAAGDLVANAVAASAVVPIELTEVTRAGVEAIRIERVRLRKTSPALVGAAFRVHLFRRPPTVTAGDNGVFDNGTGLLSLADITGYVGSADIIMDRAAAIGAIGVGLVNGGGGITCETGAVVGKERSLWALIEARGAYTPIAGETFALMIEGARS